MIMGKEITGLWPRICDSDYLALLRVIKGILGIVLRTSVSANTVR